MTDHQLYISVGVPFFSLILVWLGTTLFNRAALAALRTSIEDLRDALTARIDDTNQRISRIENRLDSIDNELRIGHERRLATLEAQVLRQAS